ncbi:DNA-binding Lrp family transcriptional regulator [Natranaerovirga pectinivora]|uniref:DNA-binding Lrp family transcriptional regulator n=1 Tax=Natranaerovirga pectinivora TaxID=682400 RepID=A0A4R3MF92_9FIRM|nr:Lrp/AsnC family transcriptional regulator [Natranaerovirga pectinivora]TCT12175.1 DNA-binding Lrp family transcriptional regulator [Natranaerovirga pectinivora]
MRQQILEALEKNSKISVQELGILLSAEEDIIANEIKAMEDENIICGYNTLINWDKTNKDSVVALIEVKVTPQRGQGFDKIAERIYRFKEVRAVYLMSGGFDLTVIIEGRTMQEVASFVSNKLAPLEAVLSTGTHFVMKKYKEHGIILEKDDRDERMLISP